MKTPKAPAAPDPKETAAAQTGTNVATAIANASLGNVDQITPDGSLKYTQSGMTKFYDPTTKTSYDVPRYTATQTLSEMQNKIKNQNDAAELNLGTIANQQSNFLKGYLSKPIKLDNAATEGRLLELGRKRLDPILDQNRDKLETSLANKGIQMGSEAWKRAMTQNSQATNDAYNSLLLSGRSQANQELLTERNQPLNEISALLSGSQVSQPQFASTNMPTIPTTDYAGLVNQNYQNQLGAYNTQVGAQNAKIGAVSGVLGAGLGGWMRSDRRTKKDIRLIGDTGRGFSLYSFAYRDAPGRHVGYMADEVERVHPEAVATFDGVQHVNYAMLEAL